MKYRIENTSSRARAFKVYGGRQVVKARSTATVDVEGDLAESLIADLKGQGVIIKATEAKSDPEPKEPAKSVGDVLAMAENGTHFQTFKAAAADILGDDTPATKHEIVAALKAKQS